MTQILLKSLSKCKLAFIDIIKKVICSFLQVTFFVCIYCHLFAFQYESTEFSTRLDSVGVLIEMKQYEQAKILLESLDIYFAENQMWAKWYQTLRSHYLIYKSSRNFELVEKVLRKNLRFLDKAEDQYKAKFFSLYTYVLSKNGQIYLSTINAEKALKIYSKLKDTTLIASTLKNLSISYSFFNDHESSIHYGKAHLAFIGTKNIKKTILALKNLSTYYYFGERYPQALTTIDKAIDIQNENKSESLLLKKALILSALNKKTEVFNVISSISSKFKKEMKYKNELAKIYSNLGMERESMNIRKVILPEIKDLSKREYAKELQIYAMQLLENGDSETALKYAHEVCQIFCPNYKSQNIYSLPSKHSLIAEAFLMEALLLKAKCIETKYYMSPQLEDPGKVLDAYDLSIYNLNMLREVFGALESKYLMTETMFDIFSRAINFSLDNYEKNQEIFFLDKALYYSQTSKSYVLKESISKRLEFRNLGIPEAVSSKYFELVAKSHLGEKDFLNMRDSISILEEEFEKKYPRVKEIKSFTPISIANIKKNLSSGQVLLHYFIANDSLICFGITNESEYVSRVKINEEFLKNLNIYTAILHGQEHQIDPSLDSHEVFIRTGTRIYETVLQPNLKHFEQEELNHLITIPCQHINQISFANLPLRSNAKWDKTDDLLLSKYAICYLHYTNSIKGYSDENNNVQNSVSIGLSYNEYDLEKINLNEKGDFARTRNLELAELPYAKKEAEDIARKIQAKMLINKDADFKSVKRSFVENELIHFAGHCIIDVKNYNNSYIPVYEDEEQSYKLDYSVIQSLNIFPELVVLSACNTNNGKAINSEGKFSMARVFIETGAKAVLGSNWNTPDKISYKLINLFYDKLLEGHNKARALQLAQLEFLNNDDFSSPSERNPSNWSNWALFGRGATLHFSTLTPFYKKKKYMIGIGTFLVLILLLGQRYFIKN